MSKYIIYKGQKYKLLETERVDESTKDLNYFYKKFNDCSRFVNSTIKILGKGHLDTTKNIYTTPDCIVNGEDADDILENRNEDGQIMLKKLQSIFGVSNVSLFNKGKNVYYLKIKFSN